MDLLNIALNAASAAVNIAAQFMEDARIVSSVEKDIKTQADEAMNETIIQQLSVTGIPVLSEETDSNILTLPEQCWIIDPLDGTYNFTRKFPYAAVSICLWKNDTPVCGVVADIFHNTVYSFSEEEKSTLNKQEVHVSVTDNISNATLATGFPSGASYETEVLTSFVKNIQSFKKIRAIGSASLMLANVAAGVFDVYYEKDLYIWDVAAGLGLVKNAGGQYLVRRNGNTHKYEVLACNAALFEHAKSLLVKA